jgi:quinol monooxygenase YgiN
MEGEVSWLVELAVKQGQLDNFRRLTAEMVESSRREAGVLSYQRFVSEDGKSVYAYERYADSTAALAHLRAFENTFSRRFLDMVDRRQFTVFGNLTDELRMVLDRFGAAYLRPFI